MRRHRKLKILKMLIRPHPELDYLSAAEGQACTGDTRPIRRSGRSRFGALVALRHDRWPRLSREIRRSVRCGSRAHDLRHHTERGNLRGAGSWPWCRPECWSGSRLRGSVR
jgi:hypothetical protein